MVEEIECLADAFEFLQEWPNNRRGPIFDTAFRACQREIGQNSRGRLCSYDGTENRSRWRDGVTDVAA
ncbi:MAG: DUF982 domain-containing protein [Mesorhizobium sp.]|uniref:DUF982 domain-containing protein n=1 Tax=Mesorhizobium sp. TaxID=1871066 RepID=UPI001201CF29|nr:MAG: DUF982 domain-containing protein [Mesorhizobium sp.]TIM72047.1 MAG: DUF982 domain-containing protein [Mesorhizobium sp.]